MLILLRIKMVLVDAIVNACIELYKTIQRGKPNKKEWTVISAVVGVFNEKDIKVLSLGTGSKCIGKSSMSPKGDILNDSHAEVIARRGFLKYLYFEIISYNKTYSSEVLYKDECTFGIKESVKFYFVTSMSPCGDASIMQKRDLFKTEMQFFGEHAANIISEVTLKRKSENGEDHYVKKAKINEERTKNVSTCMNSKSKPDIYRTGAKCLPNSEIQDPFLPGVLYHNTAAVRTKPGRGDPTLSLSCSDKIAKWNSIGWQGALLSLLIKKPIFVESIICGGGCPFSKESFDRAVNVRIHREKLIPIYQATTAFPDIKTSDKQPCPSSIIWSRTPEKELEVSVNGRKQGVTKKNLNKKIARTSICKKELFLLFELATDSLANKEKFVQDLLCNEEEKSLRKMQYGKVKSMATDYQNKWSAIKKDYFKVWSQKPLGLLSFTLEED